MITKFSQLFCSLILCAAMLLGWAAPTYAQNLTLTPTPTPQPNLIAAQVSDPNSVTFAQLGKNEIQLSGPYDSATFTFTMPADWKLSEGSKLNLAMAVAFNAVWTNAVNAGGGIGMITVTMNNVMIATLPITQVGEVQNEIAIPASVFSDNISRMNLKIALDSNYQCLVANSQISVMIHPGSYFTFPHQNIQPDTNLVNFPRPIIQNSISPDAALIVLPDQPSAAELQAALTIAAGLGNLSGNALLLDMTTAGKLTPEQQTNSHLIYVGKAASLPALAAMKLPLFVSGNQFKAADGNPDDGIIQMINTASSDARVTLVVSGNTDAGVVKAAQAISTGLLRPNTAPNLAVVKQVQSDLSSAVQPVDLTLSDMGNTVEVIESRQATKNYTFYIQPGMTVSSDAYFELVYGHSSLLNYGHSGISVLINGQPINSVRFTDASGSQTINRAKINIPASTVIPGNNRLTVNVNLVPFDYCAPPNLRGVWASILPESTLHLPTNPVVAKMASKLDLSTYPAPFVYNTMLSTTAFVLPVNDPDAWRAALQISSFLGDTISSPLAALTVFYGDKLPESERSKYNFIFIGRPSQLPALGEINEKLPVPMQKGTDVAGEINFQVKYRIPSSSPMGYIELMVSPWNDNNIVIALMGNTRQGVEWATSTMLTPLQRTKLAGDFAVINDQQVIAADSHLTVGLPQAVAAEAPELVAITPLQPVVPAAQTPAWILPIMTGSFLIILLILTIVAVNSWKQNRRHRSSTH